MDRKVVLLVFVSVLLLSAIPRTKLVERGVDVANPGNSSQQGMSGLGVDGIDWWRMFHHDLNHTGYSTSTVPIPLTKLWNTSDIINGSVKSSPAVIDGRVFVGSSDRNVYVLNAVTGKKIWKYPTKGVVESSPAVVGDTVFVGSDDHRVYALSIAPPRGQEWNFTTEGPVRSSPAIANGTVFFGSLDGYVYALLDDPDGNGTIDPDEVKWKFWTASPVYSSPVVSGGRVFIGASDGRVYALNVTGRYEWHFPTGDSVESSPAVAYGMVFVGSDSGKVYALNETTGDKIWSNSTGGAVKSSPAVADGRVFTGSMNGSVYALNATTGNILWNFPTEGFVYSSPAVADGKVFVGSGDNRIYVLNATTGFQIWNYTTGDSIYSSPAVAKDMVFIGSDDKKVYAFGPENKAPQPNIKIYPTEPFILQTVTFDGSASYDPDGYIVNCTWNFGDDNTRENIAWEDGKIVTHAYGAVGNYTVTLTVTDYHDISTHRKTNNASQPVTVQEAWPMYRHDWNHKGYSTSLAPVTNSTPWNMTIGTVISGDWMYSSPAVIDGVVYIGSTNGTVCALDATDGSVIWKRTPGGSIYSSPAVADGLVFVGSYDFWVYALYASNGTLRWSYETLGSIYSSPTVANGLVFVGSQDNKVYALKEFAEPGNYTHEDTRIEKWRYDTEADVVSSPTVSDGLVFVGSDDKKIYALYASNGARKWYYLTGSAVRSSPAVAHGMVFAGSDDGHVYALNATNGQLKWRRKIGNTIRSSPAIANDRVFVGSDDGNVYAYSITGNFKWKTSIGSVNYSSPVVAEGKVYIGSTDGIYALDIEDDGKKVWNYRKGGPFDSSPAILNDTLYITSKKGTLYAFSGQIHDIAITKITPPQSTVKRVAQNGTVDISVTVENQGSFNETNINVTAYYFNMTYNVINSTVINLARQNETTITLLWNTTGVAEDTYTISANATLTIDEDPTDNYLVGGNFTVGGRLDINVTDVWVKTVVGQGYNVTIYVTVKNEGELDVTDIEVIVYWSNSSLVNQTIGSTIIEELLVNASKTVSIRWITTGVAKGNYTITAKVTQLPGETDTTDNTLTDGIVYVGIPGDVNADGKVNVKDIFAVAKAFGSEYGQPKYNPNLDIDDDRKINVKDMFTTAKNFGQEDS
jgi:outer membrane protein assembly factor BamB